MNFVTNTHRFKLPRPMLLLLRISVGLAFVMMGAWKIGNNEYRMGGQIGTLFTCLESTGLWWDLVGWTQVVGGLLLLTQRFATFAALVLFGVAINIAAVNLSLWPQFGTTMMLTAYVLLGLILLLLHDLDKWQYVFWKEPPELNPRSYSD